MKALAAIRMEEYRRIWGEGGKVLVSVTPEVQRQVAEKPPPKLPSSRGCRCGLPACATCQRRIYQRNARRIRIVRGLEHPYPPNHCERALKCSCGAKTRSKCLVCYNRHRTKLWRARTKRRKARAEISLVYWMDRRHRMLSIMNSEFGGPAAATNGRKVKGKHDIIKRVGSIQTELVD